VFVENVLIPIRLLENGTTVQQIGVPDVTYYHVELSRHDVVLAEGLPAETYLDTGNRDAFANGAAAMQLHPDFGPRHDQAYLMWESFGYAPLVVVGDEIERVWAMLRLQAKMLGLAGTQARDSRVAASVADLAHDRCWQNLRARAARSGMVLRAIPRCSGDRRRSVATLSQRGMAGGALAKSVL
jgi:hypothetical protein